MNAEPDSPSHSHHRPEGFASSASHTSRVTSAADLPPEIRGTAGALLIMPDEFQVAHGRPRVEFVEYAVGAATRGQSGDAARGVVEIAKHNRLRGADLLTRGLDGTIPDRLAEAPGFDLAFLDALHTQR